MVEIDLNTVRHGRPIDQWFAIDMPPVSATDERPLSPKAERRRSSGLLLGGGHPGDSSTLSLPGLSSSANRGNGALRVKLILTVSRMPSRHGKLERSHVSNPVRWLPSLATLMGLADREDHALP